MSNPYRSPIVGDNSNNNQRILVETTVESFYFDPNRPPEPEKLSAWITATLRKAKKQGFSDIYVRIDEDPGDENNLLSYFLCICGNRLETDKEFEERMQNLRRTWLATYEAFERQRKYYESEQGKAEILEGRRAEGL